MQRFRPKAASKATAQGSVASLQDMPEQPLARRIPSCHGVTSHLLMRSVAGLVAATFALGLQISFLTPNASAAGLQPNPAAPAEMPSASISESLRPALEQVGHSVSQIQIDHWKVSKGWKEQLQSDANSISGDLSHQLPGLLEQANAAPTALDAQLRLMQNVDALYDVLVRLTLAADLTEKKSDAALLDSALQNLEAARKTVTTQLLAAAQQQHQQLTQLQARIEASQTSPSASTLQGKTIVVDNEVRRRPVHHERHRKPTTSTRSKSNSSASPAADKPGPQ